MRKLEILIERWLGYYPRWYVRFMNYNTGFEIPIVIFVGANGRNKKEAKAFVQEEVLPVIKSRLRDMEYPIFIKD